MESTISDATKSFFSKVYGWMFIGLAVTGVASYFTATNQMLYNLILGDPSIYIILIIFELVLVLVLSFLLKKMSPTLAFIMFLLFALVNGLTLSSIFLVYDIKSIAMAFFITSGMFGLFSIYGFVTKADLTKIGIIMFMGLIGIIIASVINIFILNNTLNLIISIVTVIVFTGLIAYDNQKLKQMSMATGIDDVNISKIAILGALTLYLDFINLFLALLRIFGKRK